MAVLMAKPQVRMETVNDLHAGLINLARVIQSPTLGPQFYRRLRRVLQSEDLFKECDAELRRCEAKGYDVRLLRYDTFEYDFDRLEGAFDYFIASRLGRNGMAGLSAINKGTYCARYTNGGGSAAKRFTSAVESIPAWRRRMRNVTILRRDAFEIISKIYDEPGVAVYIDPPYLAKGSSYKHDPDDLGKFGSLKWHARLAELLQRFTHTRVVVSYYDHPYLARLYKGWTAVKIDVAKLSAHQNNRGTNHVTATEVLLINGPSYTQQDNTPLFN
jgi:DNA adenine methylase